MTLYHLLAQWHCTLAGILLQLFEQTQERGIFPISLLGLDRCAHSWTIELNTRREIRYLRAPMYYALFMTHFPGKVHNVLHHQLLVFLRMSRISKNNRSIIVFRYMFNINVTPLLQHHYIWSNMKTWCSRSAVPISPPEIWHHYLTPGGVRSLIECHHGRESSSESFASCRGQVSIFSGSVKYSTLAIPRVASALPRAKFKKN